MAVEFSEDAAVTAASEGKIIVVPKQAGQVVRAPTQSENARGEPGKSAFVSKRGRPTSKQVAAIEENILSVARSVFLSDGYGNATMEAIAAAAGVSKGTLYARYASKAEMFNAVVAERLSTWRSRNTVDDHDDEQGVSSRLIRLGNSFLRSLRDPETRAFHVLIYAEAERFPELAEQFYTAGMNGAVTRLAEMLVETKGDSSWPILDAESVSRAFFSALIGWFDSESLRGGIDDEKCSVFVARLVAIFTGGRTSW